MDFESKAKSFMDSLPYKNAPYNGRNWGHPWHSLCSYHGKLKPAIAHMLVKEFTLPGETVLDPLCGVGTIPFEACLQGRIGIGNDLSELAYTVTKAKLEHPPRQRVEYAVKALEDYISFHKEQFSGTEYSEFGFNGKLPSYFEQETYKEILAARAYFSKKKLQFTPEEATVLSALLHVLHGNRPYALSRKSHPLTPYTPTGEFKYKNVIEKVTHKLALVYQVEGLDSIQIGTAVYGDYLNLSHSVFKADIIICSPPFVNSIRFYMQNWLRFWFCGWEPDDFKTADERFIDSRQSKDLDIYCGFFEMCSTVLNNSGKMILHLGKTNRVDMGAELSIRAQPWFDVIYLAGEDVSNIEKHGIKDKGATVEHQFLFLQKKN